MKTGAIFPMERLLNILGRSSPRIQAYLSLVNPMIRTISVISDPFDSLLKVIYTVATEDTELQIPITSASDGTVKWTSLITAILSLRGTFSIEEPENYMHPTRHDENLSTSSERKLLSIKDSHSRVSTHSETILNAANPEEILVVSLKNGETEARRPKEY